MLSSRFLFLSSAMSDLFCNMIDGINDFQTVQGSECDRLTAFLSAALTDCAC